MAYEARQALTKAAARQPGTQSRSGHTDERDVEQIAGPATTLPPLPCVWMPCQCSWVGLRGWEGHMALSGFPHHGRRSHGYPFPGASCQKSAPALQVH